MDLICKKYGLKYRLLRLLLELDYNSETYDTIKVNRILHNFHHHRD